MNIDRASLDRAVERVSSSVAGLAQRIHQHPELRFQEHNAARWIAETLEEHGRVAVERDLGGLATAFSASVGPADGPAVAILAEYDALPDIGHACGHNLIAAGAVGAFLALAEHAGELPGQVRIIGTPAEEGGGGKILLLDAGVFENVDAALMYHPLDRDLLAHTALASMWIEMTFQGQPSHAAIAPWEGKSALTACLETFRLIDSQRVHFRDGVRVHGFITNGGQAVNIIPERAACEFSVRARDGAELERVRHIVERCARGAAMACGVDVQLNLRRGYRDMNNNMTLARRFGEHLGALGRTARERDPSMGAGSTDMGDISHAVPSIHPYLAICDEGHARCHEHEFAACAASDRALDTMLLAAKAMARTVADLLEDDALLAAVRAEFETAEGRA